MCTAAMQDHPVWNLNEPGDSDHSGDEPSELSFLERQCTQFSDENNEQNCIVRETDTWHECDVEQNTQNVKSDGYWCAEPPHRLECPAETCSSTHVSRFPWRQEDVKVRPER